MIELIEILNVVKIICEIGVSSFVGSFASKLFLIKLFKKQFADFKPTNKYEQKLYDFYNNP